MPAPYPQLTLTPTPCRAESVDAKEAALWARQETLWQRELKRWEEERLWWDKRETQLLQKIHELHAALSQLVGSSTIVQTSSADGAEPVAQLATVQRSRSEEPQSAAQASSVGSRAESSQPTKSVLDEAMRFMPSDDASFTPPRADSFPPLGVRPLHALERQKHSPLRAKGRLLRPAESAHVSTPG